MTGELPLEDIGSFTSGLAIAMPDHATFEAIADLTALRVDVEHGFHPSNYARGRLLYALVAERRPSAIVEVGTGRGYSALCMARALVEHGVPGRIYTIDVVPPDRPMPWPFRDEAGPRTETWSRAAFWRARFPQSWLERIVSLTGRSDAVVRVALRRGTIPSVDFAFVDGGHDYRTARRDLLAVIALSGPRITLVADDVAERTGYGVAQAVRELFGGRCGITLLATDWGHGDITGPAGMALVEGELAPADRAALRAAWDRERPGPFAWLRWPR